MTCHQFMVSTEALAKNIDNPSWIVFDCQANPAVPEEGRQMYAEEHLPGAIHACMDTDLSSPVTSVSGRHPLPDAALFESKLREWGVNRDSQAVVYDAVGGRLAVRMWWMLKHWFGHECVAVLDGGMGAWLAAGHPLTSEVPPKRASGNFSARVNDDAWVSTEDLAKAVKSGDIVLVDARAGARYRGEKEPVDAAKGHIPGAINIPMDGNLDKKSRLLPAEQLRGRFTACDKPTVHSCASGVTACLNLLAMEFCGMPVGRLHPGSWSEWIRDPERKIALGDEPGEL